VRAVAASGDTARAPPSQRVTVVPVTLSAAASWRCVHPRRLRRAFTVSGVMGRIIPLVSTKGNRAAVAHRVVLKRGALKAEAATWTIGPHNRQRAAPHLVADRVGRAPEVVRRLPSAQEALGVAGGWSGRRRSLEHFPQESRLERPFELGQLLPR
jgi:hypothetical protein